MADHPDYLRAWPEAYQAARTLSATASGTGLDPLLVELVRTRCSQMNRCAYCIDMHTKDARALGESEQRLYALAAWRDAPFFSPRERAALALAEAFTALATAPPVDAALDEADAVFSPDEVAKLLVVIAGINVWNRLMAAGSPTVGSYVSRHARPVPAT